MQNLHSDKQLPPSALSNFIDAYWMVKNKTDKSVEIPIVPDGCVDIVCKNGKTILVGIMEVASLISIKPNDFYVGVRFKPGIIASLLDKDVSKFNDQLIPFETIDKILYAKLHPILSSNQIEFEKLNLLFESLFADIGFDERVLSAIKDIESSGGNITMDILCKKNRLSIKQLGRLFIFNIGLTPKKFARIIRFFHTHKYLTKEGIENLCNKVLEKGYYDQAHFNREYKLLTGLTPTGEAMSIFYNTKE